MTTDEKTKNETSKAHTPAPWSVREQNVVEREYGGGFRMWEAPVAVGEKATAGNVICTVCHGGPGATDTSREAVLANARLIAAAPRMREAIKQLAPWASAALDDEAVCDELKAIFDEVISIDREVA